MSDDNLKLSMYDARDRHERARFTVECTIINSKAKLFGDRLGTASGSELTWLKFEKLKASW